MVGIYWTPLLFCTICHSIAANTQINIERRDVYAIWGVNAAWEALDESYIPIYGGFEWYLLELC